MALPGPRRTDPDYWKTSLLMDVFGGSDSLLYRRLRDDLGLVYAAYAYQTYKWKAGWLVGYLGCKADQTGKAVEEAAALMEDLRREVPEDELEIKRLDALNSFVFNVDNPAALTSTYAAYRMRGEPLNTLDRIQEDFMEASRNDLVRLAREYLDPKKLKVVVVSDGETMVTWKDGTRITLEDSLRRTAADLGLPFRILPLR
jgi:zinc protease